VLCETYFEAVGLEEELFLEGGAFEDLACVFGDERHC
jgi:hypothetical protein